MDEFRTENDQNDPKVVENIGYADGVQNPGVTEEVTPAYEASEPVVELTFMQRLIGMVLSPMEVFSDLERAPRVLFPFLLVAFSQVIFLGARFSLYKLSMLDNMKMIMKGSPMQLSAEQMQAAVNSQAVVGLIATPIVSVVFFLLGTAIVMGIFRIFGGQGSFKQYLSMNGYTNVIGVIYLAIAFVLSFFTGNIYIDVPYDSVATFMGPDMRGTWVFGIAKGIRIFSIWQFGLFAAGLAYISKVDKRIVYGLVAIGFVALVLFGGYGEAQLAKYMK